MRLTLARRCSGVTAMSAMMVEQLGLATMPPFPFVMPFSASALTSGITRGTPSIIRKAELLSTTCPCLTGVSFAREWGSGAARCAGHVTASLQAICLWSCHHDASHILLVLLTRWQAICLWSYCNGRRVLCNSGRCLHFAPPARRGAKLCNRRKALRANVQGL